MSYLVGLLAFAAVMIVLATLVTVVVEALHGIAQLRQAQLRSLLAATYERAVRVRAWPVGGTDEHADSDEFVDALLANPALRTSGERHAPPWGWLRRVPLLGRLFDDDLAELDTRQFIEQLAHSRAGRAFAEMADDALRETLTELAHEFERLGQAASAFFTQRARALSLIAAAIVAVTVNVDALALYRALASDRALATRVVDALDIESRAPAASAPATPASAGSEGTAGADQAVAEWHAATAALRSEAARLLALGLPIGRRYFPYCAEAGEDAVAAASAVVDARCAAGGSVASRLFSAAGLGWLLSTLVSAGLIGLGAPFWFRVYRAAASALPGFGDSRHGAARAPGGKRPSDSPDRDTATSADALLRTFRIAARSATASR